MLLQRARVVTRCTGAVWVKTFVRTLSSSESLPPGWELIKRKNGGIVYYNADLRKTVRQIPGYSAPQVVASGAEQQSTASVKDEPTEPTISHTEFTEPEHVVPIDFDKAMTIEGHEAQVVHIELEPQQYLRAETGVMLYMTDGVEMETTTAGGFQQGVKRLLTGENFFVSKFIYRGQQTGRVALGTSFPSKVLRLRLSDFAEGSVICQKGAFLCGSDTVNIEMEFAKKFGVGFFGGEGFILQRLTGSGDALVRVYGALIERELAPGEVLRISSGCLVGFEPSVHFDITMMKGVKNVVFGGEGLFITTLTGPGRVYLQSLPFDRVVTEITSRIPRGGGGMMFPFMGGGGASGSGEGGQTDAAGDVTESDSLSDDTRASDTDSSTWNSSDESIYGGGGSSNSNDSSSGESFEDGDFGSDASEAVESGGIMDLFDSFFRRD